MNKHGEPEIVEAPLLALDRLSVSYRNVPVLQDVSLHVLPQQIAAIVGPNGAGKTTILKAIAGLIQPTRGEILFEGRAIHSLEVWDIVRLGVVYVPEGMNVFPAMTVLENLEVGAYINRSLIPERLDTIYTVFPELYERRNSQAGILSGGQKRMLVLARGLMSGARLLLLDDPFLGLSPKITRRFCEVFRVIRQGGITLFIASQHVRRILNVADPAFLIEDGSITITGSGTEVLHNRRLKRVLFGDDE